MHRFDLLNSSKGVEEGKAAYNRLRHAASGKRVHLKGRMQGSAFYISEMKVGGTDIFHMPEFIMLHNAGDYANRPLHLSM